VTHAVIAVGIGSGHFGAGASLRLSPVQVLAQRRGKAGLPLARCTTVALRRLITTVCGHGGDGS
jgi:hypothetical protein